MTTDELDQIVTTLQQHVRDHADEDRELLIYRFLAPYGLHPTEQVAIVDEFRRREQQAALATDNLFV